MGERELWKEDAVVGRWARIVVQRRDDDDRGIVVIRKWGWRKAGQLGLQGAGDIPSFCENWGRQRRPDGCDGGQQQVQLSETKNERGMGGMAFA